MAGTVTPGRHPGKGKRGRGVPVYCDGHLVGAVIGDVFRKTIQGSKHLLRNPPAIAFTLSTLDDAARAGARRVEVHDAENGRVYRASIGLIRAKGFPVRRGAGEQIALALSYWTSGDGVQLALL